jgi:uncharacterized membrane protein
MVVLTLILFATTTQLDRAAAAGHVRLPDWVSVGGADAARQVLTAIAAVIITVAGVVFSITILVLQLASQQFGPRMLRNFIRDLGTQISVGFFVATFVYSILTLAAVTGPGPREFVPHLSGTVALALTLVDLAVLVYFISHVASSIQLTSVVSGIARDFRTTLGNVRADAARMQVQVGFSERWLQEQSRNVVEEGAPILAAESGFLQAIGHKRLVDIATESDAIIRLMHRPGNFLAKGQPVAYVVPAACCDVVSRALNRTHIVGRNRTLTQDPVFAIDQLVEVAIRALSPAVNDTFTALNCIDWLGDCLCRAASAPLPIGMYRDTDGSIRVIEPALTMERLIKGASDKIRQAGRGMPAVLIRQLENLRKLAAILSNEEHCEVVRHQAAMIMKAAEESIPEPSDVDDVRAAYSVLLRTFQSPAAAARRPGVKVRARHG